MATHHGGRMKGGSQREVIIIDDTPSPEPKPEPRPELSGASLQGAVRDGNVETGYQQPAHSPVSAMQPTVSAPPARSLIAVPPSPAARLLVQNASNYYANYNAVPPLPSPLFNASFHANQTAPLPQPNNLPPLIVIDDSPSPPSAGVSSSIGLQHQPGPLQFPAVRPQFHKGSHNFNSMGHRVLAPELNGNFANYVGPFLGNDGFNMRCNTGNEFRPSFPHDQPYNIPLPPFSAVDAQVNQDTRDRNAVMPNASNGQLGVFDRPLLHKGLQDEFQNMPDLSLPRLHRVNKQPENISASTLPNLRGGHYPLDNRPPSRRGDTLLMRPDPFHLQQCSRDAVDLMWPPPYQAAVDPSVDMGNVTDERVLEILELNPTIAKQFRSACALRLQRHQQSLDMAYNQRLVEMENYTRKWRDHTWELWQTVRAGQVHPANVSQQAALTWQGPQAMAKSPGFQLPSIDAHLDEPITNSNNQTASREASAHVPGSGARLPPPKARPRRPRRKAQPGQCQRRQVESSPGLAGPSSSDGPLPDAQIDANLPTVQQSQLLHTQANHSQPESSQLAPSRRVDSRLESDSLPVPGQNFLGQPDPSQTTALQRPQDQPLCPEWTDDFEGFVKDVSGNYTSKSTQLLTTLSSGTLGPSFASILNLSYSGILFTRFQPDLSHDGYRKFDRLSLTRNRVYPDEVVVDMSETNVLMFGKAFCYMKERRERLRYELGLARSRQSGVEEEISRMHHFFSRQHINKTLSTRRHPGPGRFGVFSKDPVHEARRLLIARPKHQDGQITGATYFDIGSEQPTTRTDRDNSIVLDEDSVTFGRLVAMVNLCITLRIVVAPGAPEHATKSNEEAVPTEEQGHLQSQVPQNHMVSLDPKIRWSQWVKVVEGSPHDYLRMDIKEDKRVFEMGFHKYPIDQELSRKLGIPASRKVWLKIADAKGVAQYFSLETASMVINPVVSGHDVVIHWTAGNVLIFWKAFCLLKERMDALSGRSSEIESPASHEHLFRYYLYRDFLAKEDVQTKLQTISLPISSSVGEGIPICDIAPGGIFVDRRLVLVRPLRQDGVIDRAELFDVGTVSPINVQTAGLGDIFIPEHSAIASRILHLLMKSTQMEMFPSLKGLGLPLDPLPKSILGGASCAPEEGHSTSQLTPARLNVPALPCSSSALSTTDTQGAALIKRVIGYSTDLRRFGLNILPNGPVGRTPSPSPSQPSPSLSTAKPGSVINAAVEDSDMPDEATLLHAASNPKDKDDVLMDVDGAFDKKPLEPRKHSISNADDTARPTKRIRLAVLVSDSPAQQTFASATADAHASAVAPEEVEVLAAANSTYIGHSESHPLLDDRRPADDVLGPSGSASEQSIPQAAASGPTAPTIVHRAATTEPEGTITLPSALGGYIDRPKSASDFPKWPPAGYKTARSNSIASEPADSSYVTAAEAND